MKEKKYDIFLSVFNQHINNAGKKALKIVNEMYSVDEKEVQELNRMYKSGIMKIFKVEPNFATQSYCSIVYCIVNKCL